MSQFEGFEDRPAACAVCETMLPEAVDGMLSEAEQRALDKHIAGCVECALELAEAKRGAAWLSLLKSQAPEPPAGLLARILAETTGTVRHEPSAAAAPAASFPAGQPGPRPLAIPPVVSTAPQVVSTSPQVVSTAPQRGFAGQWAAIRKQWSDVLSTESARIIFQPRFAMTAAMAFFSIALTLNLAGVRLRDLRASDFTPSALKRTVADVGASATRRFQNNRAVYQVESRLSELRSDDAPDDAFPAGHR